MTAVRLRWRLDSAMLATQGSRTGALFFDASSGSCPVNAAVQVLEEQLVRVQGRQVTERGVERSSAIKFLVPGKRVELSHAISCHASPVGDRVVSVFVDVQQVAEAVNRCLAEFVVL